MLKVGDKVVCIDNDDFVNILVKFNRVYIVTDIFNTATTHYLQLDTNIAYESRRFKLLSEIRKEKLDRLCST